MAIEAHDGQQLFGHLLYEQRLAVTAPRDALVLHRDPEVGNFGPRMEPSRSRVVIWASAGRGDHIVDTSSGMPARFGSVVIASTEYDPNGIEEM